MSSHIVRCSCFKLKRKSLEGCLFKAHRFNHLSPTLIWRHAVEPLFFTVKHANTCWSVHLMTTECEEVAIHILYVYSEMRGALGTIHQHRNAVFMGNTYHLLYGIDRTEHIADVGNTDNFGLFREQLLVFFHHQHTVIGHRDDTNGYASLCCLQLPRYDIAMMFHRGDDDFIALLHESLGKRRSHEIDTLGGATCENNLFGLRSIDELAHFFARSLMQFRCLLRQVMNATMHVGIHIKILLAHSVKHTQRFLGCRRII